jgi:hypothetical protein
MNFKHDIEDVNLIITALEHKIRNMQMLVQKMIAVTQEQMPVAQPAPEATETSQS